LLSSEEDFAGPNLAKRILLKKDIRVTLVDKKIIIFFPPLIYQVATASLEPSSISYLLKIFLQEKKSNLD
jgi:NADH dehydrogenase